MSNKIFISLEVNLNQGEYNVALWKDDLNFERTNSILPFVIATSFKEALNSF